MYNRMPKIRPDVLGSILIKIQDEIHEIYLISKNDEMTERLLVLHQKLEELILVIESLVS
jgi:predicted RNA-binding protein